MTKSGFGNKQMKLIATAESATVETASTEATTVTKADTADTTVATERGDKQRKEATLAPKTTQAPTTTPAVTVEQDYTTEEGYDPYWCHEPTPQNFEPAHPDPDLVMTFQHFIFLLDHTGSMQPVRNAVIKNYNEKFLPRFKGARDTTKRIKYTFASFNENMVITSYEDLFDAVELDRRSYNPGYNTRLYDSVGCLLDKYSDENNVFFYVLSDGKNNWHEEDIFTAPQVKERVQRMKDEQDWKFEFFGAISDDTEREELKEDAEAMGWDEADGEITFFERNEKSLKSGFGKIRRKMVKSLFGSQFGKKAGKKARKSGKKTRKTNAFLGWR